MMFADFIAESFSKEMGYTHREFLRNLPAALKDIEYGVDENIITIHYDGGEVEIVLGEIQQRKIASLAMPYMHVQFTFRNLSADQRKRFYTPFQRSYQKGGG